MSKLSESIKLLEKIAPLRAKEDSQRWRACYDLILAQCLAYRVRLFQYMLVLDNHVTQTPKRKDPKNNEWNIGRGRKPITPDEKQFERIKRAFKVRVDRDEYLEQLRLQKQKANDRFVFVEREHPGTPWEHRSAPPQETWVRHSAIIYIA